MPPVLNLATPAAAPTTEAPAADPIIAENPTAANSMEHAPESEPIVNDEPETLMESEEPLDSEVKKPPPPLITRTTSSPFLDLKAPASPVGNSAATSNLFFGKKPAFGFPTKDGAAAGASIFQLPSSAAASSTTGTNPFAAAAAAAVAASNSAPKSLFGSLSTQSTPVVSSPLTGGMFGAKIGQVASAEQPKGLGNIFGSALKGAAVTFGSKSSAGVNPFAKFSQPAEENKTEEVAEEGDQAQDRAIDEIADGGDAEIQEETGEESPTKAVAAVTPSKVSDSPIEGAAVETPISIPKTKVTTEGKKPVVLSVSQSRD